MYYLLLVLIGGVDVQPRVAAAENMRYEEDKKNSGIKAEKTILHDGEVASHSMAERTS